MATKGERQALLFLAAVAMLGAGTRAWRARHPAVDTGAIDAQLRAVDSGRGRPPRRPRPQPAVTADPDSRREKVDLDRASAGEIEALPGIGPALAKRIVDDRAARGAFGCLRALDEVKGIGAAMLARLDSLVVFSGPARPSCVSGGVPPVPPGERPAG
jgi:DNA uptake protein ComE-like DNA-binding protein